MVLRWYVARLAGPLLRALPPWYRLRLYSRIVGNPFRGGIFSDRVDRVVWPHGYIIQLDMSDWMERFAAIAGIFYELEATKVLLKTLKPGSCFLDVGGNIGFLSLTAAAIVGDTGKVIYAEPNAKLAARFRASLDANSIRNVEIVEAAVGEREGFTSLSQGDHHGTTQLADGVDIKMVTGDSLLRSVPDGAPLLVKIDVEGYEEKVLFGMPAIRARQNTSFLVEITDTWLRRRGGGAKSLIDMMIKDGFRVFHPRALRDGSLQLSEVLEPLPLHQYDLVFARDPVP